MAYLRAFCINQKSGKKVMTNPEVFRLAPDTREDFVKFLELCGAPKSKIVNELIRIGLPVLQGRLKAQIPLFPPHKLVDPHAPLNLGPRIPVP